MNVRNMTIAGVLLSALVALLSIHVVAQDSNMR